MGERPAQGGRDAVRGHFRIKARPGRRVELAFQVEAGGALSPTTRAVTKNIGIGGAFIVTPAPPAVGTTLLLTLAVPPGEFVEVRAEVRWIVAGGGGPAGHETGMGVKFAALDVEQLVALNDYFATLAADLVEHDES